MRKRKEFLLGVLLVSVFGVAFALPKVISVDGPTVSAAPFLRLIKVNPKQLLAHLPKGTLRQLSHRSDHLRMPILPVSTPNMTPGIIKPHLIHMPTLSRKLFLVGSDPLSKRWLRIEKPELIHLRAVGLLVQVKTPAQLRAMQQLAKPLLLTPVSAKQIGKALHLAHYPVLISNQQVDQ